MKKRGHGFEREQGVGCGRLWREEKERRNDVIIKKSLKMYTEKIFIIKVKEQKQKSLLSGCICLVIVKMPRSLV